MENESGFPWIVSNACPAWDIFSDLANIFVIYEANNFDKNFDLDSTSQ